MSARSTTATSNASIGRPPKPANSPNHENRVTKTAVSATENATNSPGDGSTSANHGRSHSPYWGEYTLFVRRNSTRIGNPKVQRAKSGSRARLSHQTKPVEPRNNASEAVLMSPVGWQYSSPVIRWHEMNHRLSQSAGRSELNAKNRHHDPGAATANGTFTATHVPIEAHARWMPASGSRSRNLPATNGTTSSAGESFAAAPSPSSTPDTTSRRRAYASVAAAASATARRSQFMKP